MSDADTTADLTGEPARPDQYVQIRDYDPSRHREIVRASIACGLIFLLIGVVSAVIYGVLSKTIPLNELDRFPRNDYRRFRFADS